VKHIAFATGLPSGVVVTDADDEEALAAMEAKYGEPHVRTRRGGHWYWKHPGDGKVASAPIGANSAHKLLPGNADSKADGAYVLAPPSPGKSWTAGVPDPESLPVLPPELRPPSSTPPPSAGATELPEDRFLAAAEALAANYPEPGVRHEAGLPLAGFLMNNGVSAEDAYNLILEARSQLPKPVTADTERSIRGVVDTTARKLANGDKDVTGGPSLEGLVPGLVGALSEALGFHSRSVSSTGMRNGLKRSFEAISFAGRRKPGPRESIVENLIWKSHAAGWYGEGGIAKSLLALHLGLIVASPDHDEWFGHKVKTGPVLYLDFELDADEQHRRLLALSEGESIDMPETFYYLSAAGGSSAEAFAAALQEAQRLGVILVTVDSVGFALEGDSELAKDVLGFFRERIDPLKAAGITPLLIDHQSKIIKGEKYSDKQAFGSVYKTNAVRSMMQLRGEWGEGEMTATFRHTKNNFGYKEPEFSIRLRFEAAGYRKEASIRATLLDEALPNPDHGPTALEVVTKAWQEAGRATAEEIATATELDLKTVRNAASGLLRDGVLEDTGEKAGRSRILIPHSRTTKGTGTTDKPSTNGHTNGHKTVPTEVMELAIEQVGKNGITGEYGGEVVPRAARAIHDHRELFGEPETVRAKRQAERLAGRPVGWKLLEDVKQYLEVSELDVPAALRELDKEWDSLPPRVKRWAENELDKPDRFYDMPEDQRQQLLAWVQENVAARRGKGMLDSYLLKHVAERRIGFYVSNGELKGAMLEAGHRPVWDNRINMGFCCAAKPGSPWGNELRKEAEARREEWKPQPGPEELLREAIEVVKHEFPELYDQLEEPEAS
jgi:hypothetical protein